MSHEVSTGIPHLDSLLEGPHPGDSIVSCADCASSYGKIVERLAETAGLSKRRMAYLSWSAEKSRLEHRAEPDFRFDFDLTKDTEEQLESFLEKLRVET